MNKIKYFIGPMSKNIVDAVLEYMKETKNKIGFEEIKEAMIYGTLTASFCVESFGVEGLRKLDKETLNNRLEIFKSYLT